MATKIVTKNSSTASAVPTASDLVQGELAVNVADKRLFTEDNGGSIVELGTNPTTLTVDTTTLVVDSTNNRVGIGTSSPSQALTVNGTDARIYLTGANTDINMDASGNGQLFLDGNGYAFGIALNASGAQLYTNSASRNLIFGVNETEVMRVTDSNVGIGTSSPASTLHVNSDTTALQLTNSATGSAATDGFQIRHFASSSGFVVIDQKEAAGLSFQIAGTEVGRFVSAGHWCVGRTGTSVNAEENGIVLNPNGIIITAKDGTTSQTHINFVNNAAVTATSVGTIKTNGSATSYNTSSDYRLKTDAQPMTGATARLKALKPVNFEWIADGTRVDGFLAHEAQAVVPECVSGEKDAMQEDEYEVTPAVLDEEGNTVEEAVMGTRSVPDYQGIDQSKLVPLLVATIQELEARITQLENS